MSTKPWRCGHFNGGYAAEYLPPGQRSWRIVKVSGNVAVFASPKAALAAAQDAYLARLEPKIRATLPVDPGKLAAKLADEAENWLKSTRADRKRQEVTYRSGKRPFLTLPGKAQA